MAGTEHSSEQAPTDPLESALLEAAESMSPAGNPFADGGDRRPGSTRYEFDRNGRVVDQQIVAEPEQPTGPPEATPASEPARDERGRFTTQPDEQARMSARDVLTHLKGRADLSPEQREQLRAERAYDDLASGEPVREIAAEQAEYDAAVNEMIDRHPGLQALHADPESEAADELVAAFDPVYQQVAAEYGEEVTSQPEVIEAIYNAIDGDRFAPDPLAQALTEVIEMGASNPFR